MGHFDNIIIRAHTGETVTQDTGTIYQDLPEKGYLSALSVDMAMACTFSTDPGLDIWNAMTKFEVLVDGSKVVKSYDAKQLRALACYWGIDLSTLGSYGRHGTEGDKTFWNFPILFGRYPGDKEYMLDLERYSNPQLRITYNTAQTSVDGATYYATADPYVRSAVQGLIYRDGAPPGLKGYIKSTEIDNWSVVGGTTRQTEIPKGNNIIGYMQGARYLDQPFIYFIESTELTFDNGEWQLLDHGYQELKALNTLWFPREAHTVVYKDMEDVKPLDLMLGEATQFQAMPSLENICIPSLGNGLEFNIQNVDIDDYTGAAPVKTAYNFSMFGQFPHQNMYIPLWKYSKDDEYGIDTTKYGRIDIKTTTGSSADTHANLQTVAEYVVPTGE